jgi:hypothetical protein
VLRSEQESQSSLDLDFQIIFSLSRRSSKEVLREVSIEKDLELGGGGGGNSESNQVLQR